MNEWNVKRNEGWWKSILKWNNCSLDTLQRHSSYRHSMSKLTRDERDSPSLSSRFVHGNRGNLCWSQEKRTSCWETERQEFARKFYSLQETLRWDTLRARKEDEGEVSREMRCCFQSMQTQKCHAVLSCSLMFSQTFFSKWFIHKSDSRRQKEGERKENEVQVEISCIAILPEQNCSLLNCTTETQTERMRKKWCWGERTHLES